MSLPGRTISALLLVGVFCTCAPAPEKVFVERPETGVDNINQLTPTEDFNIVEYLYYYNGGGVAATDINGDGLPDLYFTNNQLPNRYYINEGDWNFRDATEEAGVAGAGSWSTGVSIEDVNADGLPDIYVCNVGGYRALTGRNELFVQNRDGTFTESAREYGLGFSGFNTQAYWFDYDLDGDKDIYLLRHSVHNDATYGRAAAREIPDSLAGDKLLRNDSGRFTEVTAEMGIYSSKIGYGLSVAVADYDGNGYPDIYVCNDFSENDYLYLNQEGKGFTESVRERMGHTSNFSMGSDVADLDDDGWPDIISLDMRPGDEAVLKSTASADAINVYRIKRSLDYYDQLPRNNVQWNRGGGHFSEIGELTGLAATDWSWSVLAEDFDLDGQQEVFIANGIVRRPNDLDYLKFVSSAMAREASDLAVVGEMPTGEVANQLFVRTGELHYEQADWGLGHVGSSTGAAVADFDGDGDMDLVTNNVNGVAEIYENRSVMPDDVDLPGDRHRPVIERWTAQRGFQSQSQLLPPPPVMPVPQTRFINYSVAMLDDTIGAAPDDFSFDREPLQPYVGAGSEGPPSVTLPLPDAPINATATLWGSIIIDGQTLANTEGWWQSLSVVEIEGKTELIAGNWGLNSALGQPTEAAPLRLYATDVDGNGKIDPLITYVRGDKEVSLASKDDLTGQLPGWRRNNLSYADFSGRSFTENFPEVRVKPKRATTLAHHRIYRADDGSWVAEPLPPAAQLTTLNVAAATPRGILLGGNTLEVLPRIGRQDAAALQLLLPDGKIQFIDLGERLNRLEVRTIRMMDDGGYRIGFKNGGAVKLTLE